MSEERCKGDPNSCSNPGENIVTHMDLHLDVDFDKHVLKGYVDLTVDRIDNKANLATAVDKYLIETKRKRTDSEADENIKTECSSPEIINAKLLDAYNLTIINVRNKNNLNKIAYKLSEPKDFGSKLEVTLPKETPEKIFYVRIEYETSPQACGLQWLEPCQTAGKKHPYVFSQNQAINARSMVPCQDTPSVKSTYSAVITAPKELTVLMSAVSNGSEEGFGPTKTFKFQQSIPIPSYLIAIVVGKLESRRIGPRSHVWSEKEYVDRAAEEFTDTETMIAIAEELLGEYVWGIYDLLVLPPSFSYGGMENPCLTFVTPALLAGDKSLVCTIAHEISHSWTGNLVTNRNFEHFWLNEGFTMFAERKIIGRMLGESNCQFHALCGWKSLKYDVENEQPEFTKLIPNLKATNPDDAFNLVPYEKGYTFLYYLEELLGGPDVFEKFLKSYIEEYKKKSIDTDVWKSYLFKYFSDKEEILNKVDWNAWLFAPGMPPVKPEYDSSLQQKCVDLSTAWVKANEDELKQFSADDIAEFSALQVQEYLSLLQEEVLSITKIEKLNEVYKFNDLKNSEILFKWIRLALKARWKNIIPKALQFVNEFGRLKFVRPIYRDLYQWEEIREEAIANFKAHASEMMFVTSKQIRKDLHLSEGE